MWLARDLDNTLHVFISNPIRDNDYWKDNYYFHEITENNLIDFESLEWKDDPIEVISVNYWTVERCVDIFMTVKVFKYKFYVDSKK